MLVSACAVAPYEAYYDVPVGVTPPPVSVEYPGYYWTSPRWRPADAYWVRDARPRPAPEREARRSIEHAPAYRQQHGHASPADNRERWHRERSDTYRVDRHRSDHRR